MTCAYRFAKAYQEQLLESAGYGEAGYNAEYQQNELAETSGIAAITRIWRQLTPSVGLKGTKASLEPTVRLSQKMP